MTPDLCKSHTYHKRIGGPDNAFRYSVDYVLSEPETSPKLPHLLSRNAFNLTSIHDKDHGGPVGNGRGAAWVRDKLVERGLTEFAQMRVLLLAQPRVLGYVFNPVSFWMIVDDDDTLFAVAAEVNNTYGDRHSYLCHRDDLRPIQPDDTLVAQKLLHVSPFQKTEGIYSFRFDLGPDYYGVRIEFRVGNGGLLATLTGKRQRLTSAGILASVIRRPLGAARVSALIYYQAIRLRLKGAKFLPRPTPPNSEIS